MKTTLSFLALLALTLTCPAQNAPGPLSTTCVDLFSVQLYPTTNFSYQIIQNGPGTCTPQHDYPFLFSGICMLASGTNICDAPVNGVTFRISSGDAVAGDPIVRYSLFCISDFSRDNWAYWPDSNCGTCDFTFTSACNYTNPVLCTVSCCVKCVAMKSGGGSNPVH